MTAVATLVAVTVLHSIVFVWKLRRYSLTSAHLRDRRVLYSDVFLLVSWFCAVGLVLLLTWTGR